MGSNIIELAKLGHERAAELKASCGAVDVRSLAQLISDLATQLEVQLVRGNAQAVQLANAESKCREMAAVVAENLALKDGVNKAIEDIQCFYDSYGWHVSEDGESETAVVALDDAKGSIEHFALSVKTPASDTFLAEVLAQGVDLVCDYHKSRCEALHDVDRNGSQRHGAALCDAIDIAAKIRQGVQS